MQYYFKMIGEGTCVERCKVWDDGVMIGSVTCQYCNHCKGHNRDRYGDVSWIECDVIEQATGKKETKNLSI